MNSAAKSLSYVDPDGKTREFNQDDKNIIVTFKPQDFTNAKEVIKSNSPKGFEEKYINEEVGFARIEMTPEQTFSSTVSSFSAPPSSGVINGVISAAVEVEDVKTGPGVTRYFLPNRLFISLKDQYINDAANVFGKHGMTIVKDYSRGYFSVSLKAGAPDLQSLFNAINTYKDKPEFNYVEVHEVGFNTALLNPSDTQYMTNAQWGLRSANANNDIDASQAWDLTTGNFNKVRVAVLDSGVDINHPDINNGTFNQVAEQFNAINNQTTLASVDDGNGHGTIVAGTIGAKTNNSTQGNGLAGVAWNCGLFIVKIDQDLVTLDYAVVVNGINEVKTRAQNNNGPTGRRYVMNLSWTCANNSSVHTAITNAYNAGVVIVAAAGDNGQNIGQYPTYPAAWLEVIPAAAHTNGPGGPAIRANSNWGSKVVIAPGDAYPTTIMGGGAAQAGGTSVGSAMVSGVAALCWSRNYTLHNQFTCSRQDIYNCMLNWVVPWGDAGHPCKGRLNAFNAVNHVT